MRSAPFVPHDDLDDDDEESGPLSAESYLSEAHHSEPVRLSAQRRVPAGADPQPVRAPAFTAPPSELLDSRQRREVVIPPRPRKAARLPVEASVPKVIDRETRREAPRLDTRPSPPQDVSLPTANLPREPVAIPRREPIAIPPREPIAVPPRDKVTFSDSAAVAPPADKDAAALEPAPAKARATAREGAVREAVAARRVAKAGKAEPPPPLVLSSRRREAIGIALLSVALFVSLATLSLMFGDGQLMGPVGQAVASALYALLGIGTIGPALLLFVFAVKLLRTQKLTLAKKLVGGGTAAWLLTMTLAHLAGGRFRIAGMPPGGALGEYTAEALIAMLGTAGTVLLLGMGLLLSVTMLTPLTTRALGAKLHDAVRPQLRQIKEKLLSLLPKKRLDDGPPIALPGSGKPSSGVPRQVRDYGDDRDQTNLPAKKKPEQSEDEPAPVIVARRPAPKPDEAVPGLGIHGEPTKLLAEEPTRKTDAPATADGPAVVIAAQVPERADATEKMDGPPSHMPLPDDEPVAALATPELPDVVIPSEPDDESSLGIVQATRKPEPRKPAGQANYIKLRPYEPPPIDLFDFAEHPQHELDRKAMLDLAQRLEGTLGDYTVKGRVTAIHPGPVVTMYEFVPAPGIKLARITSLSSDLAMALEALRVRIVAPIPGKAAVGIEVPNRSRETVYLKELLADDSFRHAKSKLTMALGKDIAGIPVSVDLAKMPHLLVAGTTGSGKSVSVNTMVCSLLMNASPDEVKMIMIDPKMLELSIYEGIPHLLLPVVTDPKKAALALRWAVEEMDRRYDLISKAGVRDIGGFNKKVEKHQEITASGQLSLGVDPDDFSGPNGEPIQKLPFIVVLIDEFADLMMVAGKEVEICVARIAQKARAAGIHLILATQRPSVDVITGLIKANFPSRIAFQVASRVDSRTILDQQGAENLLGMGDMLFTDRGQALRRIHGALITDGEVHRVVEHLKQLGKPIYDMDILKPRGDDEQEGGEEEVVDELYDQAVRIVSEGRQISISMLQRKMRIGYNRSARMIERMERDSIVGPADGAKGVREVLIHNH
ncbi:MAG: DNA translocase FtsK 4TM domain-containing protein [Polyangia bacterium]